MRYRLRQGNCECLVLFHYCSRWFSLGAHERILLCSFSQFGGPSVSASREIDSEDEELNPSSRYGLLPTLYWHLLTGPVGAYVRLVGDAAAWLTTIFGRKMKTIVSRARSIMKRWRGNDVSASNVWSDTALCEYRVCMSRWYISAHKNYVTNQLEILVYELIFHPSICKCCVQLEKNRYLRKNMQSISCNQTVSNLTMHSTQAVWVRSKYEINSISSCFPIAVHVCLSYFSK